MDNSTCFLCGNESKNLEEVLDNYICKECIFTQQAELKKLDESRTQFYPEINKITENIFLGNQDAARDKDLLKELNITHVLCCASFIDQFHPNHFTYKSLELDDDPKANIQKYFKECIEYINSGEKVFVHCHAGISRSASIVIAYLMWKEKLSFSEAKEFVKSRRPAIYPNSGFEMQLSKFEKLMKENNYVI
jgi:protein-tyrosine phosphatase